MSDPAHRAAAARELLKRKAICNSLTEFCRSCGFEPALHHQLIIRELEALERGEFDRLVVSAPPGSAKTTYVSHLFPPWYLARHPEHLVLSGSHTQEFASRKIGRKVRNLIEQHSRVLGIELDRPRRAWTTGRYRVAAVIVLSVLDLVLPASAPISSLSKTRSRGLRTPSAR